MTALKTFKVFGEPIEVLVPGEATGGLSTTITQTSPAGGGPPPHSHTKEDETFYVLEGEYEFLADGQWHKAEHGRAILVKRGSVHTFRQRRERCLIFLTPSGLEKYLEEISSLSMPQDAPQLMAISERYGISFAQ